MVLTYHCFILLLFITIVVFDLPSILTIKWKIAIKNKLVIVNIRLNRSPVASSQTLMKHVEDSSSISLSVILSINH